MGITRVVNRFYKSALQKSALNDDSVNTVTVEDRFSIDVPSYLSPTKEFGDAAKVQYKSRGLDMSFAVTELEKSKFDVTLEDLRKKMPDFIKTKSTLEIFALTLLAKAFDLKKVQTAMKDININGLNAITVFVHQKMTFFKPEYNARHTFVEGKESFYTICFASHSNTVVKLYDKLDRYIMSFKEL